MTPCSAGVPSASRLAAVSAFHGLSHLRRAAVIPHLKFCIPV